MVGEDAFEECDGGDGGVRVSFGVGEECEEGAIDGF